MSMSSCVKRALSVALAAGVALSANAVGAVVPAHADGAATSNESTAWTKVYRHDFDDLADVAAFNSGPDVNDSLRGSDTGVMQQPVVRSNVEVVHDPAAEDGKAMAVHTRKAGFRTSRGTQEGWSNGRMAITDHNAAPPVRVRTRMRFTASVHTKSAVMWWPAGGGWPWEIDFAETFGGDSLTDYWGGRQNVGQRWHSDLNGDGQAREQLIHDDRVDGTRYHVYDLHILPDRMWIDIDGRTTYETRDRRYIPKGAGFFTVGKALTHRRDSTSRTADAVVVDYLEIYKGGSSTTPPSPPGPPQGSDVAYFANAYSPTVYAVDGRSRIALTYAQWAAAGFPRPAPTPTDYVRYPWSSTVYAVTFWPGTWQWDRLDLAKWEAAGYPAVRHAGWIEGSVIRRASTGDQLLLHDPDGGVHPLTYDEWQATGFRPPAG